MKKYMVYADVTGTGTGNALRDFDTEAEALTFAEAQWTPAVGYVIHTLPTGQPPIAHRIPTHPEITQAQWDKESGYETEG